MPLSLGNIILLKEKLGGGRGMSELILRQVDKKSRVPEEEKLVCSPGGGERGPESSRRRKGSEAPKEDKGTNTFFPTLFFLSQYNSVSCSRICFS